MLLWTCGFPGCFCEICGLLSRDVFSCFCLLCCGDSIGGPGDTRGCVLLAVTAVAAAEAGLAAVSPASRGGNCTGRDVTVIAVCAGRP